MSGAQPTATATFDNTTIQLLGLNTGTYNYTETLSSGLVETVITVNIASVPEPTSITMAATAMGLVGGLALRRRRGKKA